MKLSRNFSLSELIKSDTAIRLGIDNNPNADQIEKLKLLCENILQPVRDHFGRVTVTSCFRSPELCVKIGSSLNSQHTKAEAADFRWLLQKLDLVLPWNGSGGQLQREGRLGGRWATSRKPCAGKHGGERRHGAHKKRAPKELIWGHHDVRGQS